MRFQVLTLFPERYAAYIDSGLPARAHKKGLFELEAVSLRDFTEPARRGRVDDAPYGGGPGMLLEVGPIDRALQALPVRLPVVLLSARGEQLTQPLVRQLAAEATAKPGGGYTLVCGYYEGVDERVAEHLVDYEVCIGPFVLGSGDLAALCLIEALTRLLPGYMGSDESHRVESNENGVLEYAQYTRPPEYRGWKVPEILLSGNHGAIEEWRREQSQAVTQKRKASHERRE